MRRTGLGTATQLAPLLRSFCSLLPSRRRGDQLQGRGWGLPQVAIMCSGRRSMRHDKWYSGGVDPAVRTVHAIGVYDGITHPAKSRQLLQLFEVCVRAPRTAARRRGGGAPGGGVHYRRGPDGKGSA